MYPSGRLIARARQLQESLMPDTATIARTGASMKCRVTADTDKRGVHLDGFPSTIHLARWELAFPEGPDLRVGDIATVAGKGDYSLLLLLDPESYTASANAHAIALDPALTCSTLRQPSALDIGQTAAYSTHLSSLKIRPLTGVTFIPISPQFSEDSFGVALQQPAVIYADWPAGNTEQQPVVVNDIITFPDATQYVVAGVQCWYGWRMAIVVEMAVS